MLTSGQKLGQTHNPVHDPCAILAVIHPELFESRRACVDIECRGELTRGQSVADWKGQWKRPAQTTILTKVDADAAHAAIVRRIGSLRFPDLGELGRLAPSDNASYNWSMPDGYEKS